MDTEEGEDEEPSSLHKYILAEADPVDNTDSSGNEIDEIMGGLGMMDTINAMPTITPLLASHPFSFKRFNAGAFASTLDTNASLNLRDGGNKPATKSIGRCAQYVRLALAAGGITVTPGSAPDAANYMQVLPLLGFQFVAIWDSQSGYAAKTGHVAVFGATFLWPNPHPYGHIEGYDGSRWVSDFIQRGFIPYKVKSSAGPSRIYRYPFLSGN